MAVSSFLARRVEFLSVLRNRDYRVYYVGMLSSVTGHQALTAVQGWLVYDLTGLPAALGFVAGAQAVPGIVFNLVAGALADRVDPRRLIVIGQGSAAVLTAALATLVLTGQAGVFHILVFAFLTGAALSFDQPARRTVWPALVPRHQFMFAASLNQTIWNGTRVFAPGIGMGIIAVVDLLTGDPRLGAAIAFYAVSMGLVGMVVAVLMINMPPLRRSTGATVLHDIRDGLVFVGRNRVFLVLLLLGFTIGFFGLSYAQLMPAFAKDDLELGPTGLGVLLSVNGAGGIIGILMVASFGQYQSRAWVMGGGAVLFGVTVVLLGLAGALGSYAMAVVFIAGGGALYSVFQISANTVLSLLVPEEFRGRVMGLRGIMWSLSPLGALMGGLVATWVNTPFAIALGGAVVIVVTVVTFAASAQIRRIRSIVAELDAAPVSGGTWR